MSHRTRLRDGPARKELCSWALRGEIQADPMTCVAAILSGVRTDAKSQASRLEAPDFATSIELGFLRFIANATVEFLHGCLDPAHMRVDRQRLFVAVDRATAVAEV